METDDFKSPRVYILESKLGPDIKSVSDLHKERMKKLDLYNELLTIYQRHGWQLRALLLTPETIAELKKGEADLPQSVTIKDSPVDGLWFSRPSHEQREAWELRLLSETQYALFETFEADETEEQRDEMRQEMEARLRDYVLQG